MENDNFDKYDDEIIDTDALKNTDIKINPDFYIHTALLKAQSTLQKDNMREGFLQFVMYIRFIEALCKANKLLDDEYLQNIKSYENNEKHSQEKDITIRMLNLALYKLELIMGIVFGSKTLTDSLVM